MEDTESTGDVVIDELLKSPKGSNRLPHTPTSTHRSMGVWRYGALGVGTCVYYLPEEHEPETVIRTWTLENMDIVHDKDRKELAELLHRFKDKWKHINKRVVDEIKGDGGIMKEDYEAVVEGDMSKEERAEERGVHPGTVSCNIHHYRHRHDPDFWRN